MNASEKTHAKKPGMIPSVNAPSDSADPHASIGEGTMTMPELSAASRLLASVIHLPDEPTVAYAAYGPKDVSLSPAQRNQELELARRHVLQRNAQKDLLSSLLPYVSITRENQWIYLFAIGSDGASDLDGMFDALQFQGLTMVQKSLFSLKELYPCSQTCSYQRSPCPACLTVDPTTLRDPATLRPRHPLRLLYSLWIEAIRERILNDICTASTQKDAPRRALQRLQSGFLLGPPPAGSEWSIDWEHHAYSRPLVFCDLMVNLMQDDLVVQAVLRPTNLFPLRFGFPIAAGAPITLLPHGTPAYFLTEYRGPTSVVTAQFEDALIGLGAGRWQPDPSDSVHGGDPESKFIIAWISVQNKQGEEKGMMVIWPVGLCLSFTSTPATTARRQPLVYIPELPAQLQMSPKPAPASPSATLLGQRAYSGPSPRPMLYRGRSSSATGSSLRAFRALHIGRARSTTGVAEDVGRYVDVVAKEREKERERMRKEREAASPRTASGGVGTASSPSTKVNAVSPAATSLLKHVAGVGAQLEMNGTNATSVAGMKAQAAQSVYPSPSASDSIAPPGSGGTAPLEPPIKLELDSTEVSDARSPAAVSSSSQTFDAFSNLDTWNQPADDFLPMDMDYNMDFRTSLSTSAMVGQGSGVTANLGIGMDLDFEDGFGTFTDDDFSFFDKPSTTARATEIAVPTGVLGPSALEPPISVAQFNDTSMPQSGPGPPGRFAPSAWANRDAPAGFEASSVRNAHRPPDLVPASSTRTPSSTSEPATPQVAVDIAPAYIPLKAAAPFGAIEFDPRHHATDDKYAMGKFALPSPPAEDLVVRSLPASPTGYLGWRKRYSAATDPRIAVIQRLIGSKRKSVDQGTREGKLQPPWYREASEDWEKESSVDAEVDPDSDEDCDEVMGDATPPPVSRPSTPPPSGLPPGASLLYTKFQHSQLLPMSKPLRPPGSAVAPTSLISSMGSASVPTPVSPAAAIGAASGSKSQEAAAQMLVKEVIDNPIWCDAWLASSVDRSALSSKDADVWHADVQRAVHALQVVSPANNMPAASVILAAETGEIFQTQEPPTITVGKADSLLNVNTPALRFWQKLGLGPKSGRKDVTAFVIFEESLDRQQQTLEWMKQITLTYTERNLGIHTPGVSAWSGGEDGLAPFRFDSFKKTLSTFLDSLMPKPARLVLYLIIPQSIMFLSSPTLRHILSAMKQAFKSYTEGQIVFEMIPEQFVIDASEDPSVRRSDLDAVVSSVYDRILVPVDRMMSRTFFLHTPNIRALFQMPAFTLSRPVTRTNVKLLRQTTTRSLDVVDRYRLLHVGYTLSSCGKWLFAARIDEGGEEHDVGVWLTHSDGGSAQIVDRVWTYAAHLIKRANVEWRVVIAKLGTMTEQELFAWSAALSSNVVHSDLPIHTSLVAVDQSSGWSFLPLPVHDSSLGNIIANPTKTADAAGTFFVEASSITYIVHPTKSLPLHLPTPNLPDDLRTVSFVSEPDGADENDDLSSLPSSPIRPLSTTLLIRITAGRSITTCANTTHIHLLHTAKGPLCSMDTSSLSDKQTHADLTRSFYELSVLTRARWRLDAHGADPALPFHLAALEVMRAGLACESVLVSSGGD